LAQLLPRVIRKQLEIEEVRVIARKLSAPSLAALALLGLSAGRPLSADAVDAKPPSASSEIAVTLVEIPVEVTRGGEPVRGLAAADFEVMENGRALPIVAAEPIDLDRGGKTAAAAAPLPEAARRHLFLLFDFAFSRPERLAGGIAAAREMVAHSLTPGDLVGVGLYLPQGDLPVLLNFTADRAAADRTLAALQNALPGRAAAAPAQAEEPDPLRLTGLGVRSLLSEVFRNNDNRNFAREMNGSLGHGDGTIGGFLIRNLLGHSAILHEGNVQSAYRDRVAALAETMAGLAEALQPVAGRKYMALFSEGFPMSLVSQEPTIADPMIGGSALLDKLNATLSELRRSGWVLHAVSLGGVEAGLTADALHFMANETGGMLVEGTNKLADGIDSAFQRSAHSYLVTVQVDVEPDGSYHPLTVRLRGTPARTQIQAREGYFAPLPFRRQKDVQRLVDAARLVAGDEESNQLGVQAVAVPLRSGGDTTPVAVVVEVPGAPLLASGAPAVGLEVYGYALTETGSSSDYFAQAVTLETAKVRERLSQGGVRVLGKLALTPGQHRLRVLVRDRRDGRFSLLTIPLNLSAPATADAQARLDALFLSSPQDPWVLARPADAAFDVHGRSVVPAAQAALPASGEAQVVLLGHGFTGPGQWIRGRILTAEGKPAAGGALELLTVSPGEAGEPDLVLGKLRAGSLPAGDYMLELRLGKKTGAVQASTVRSFLIR
jgi:VWFA-related protein